jgi:hypothetical protein
MLARILVLLVLLGLVWLNLARMRRAVGTFEERERRPGGEPAEGPEGSEERP